MQLFIGLRRLILLKKSLTRQCKVIRITIASIGFQRSQVLNFYRELDVLYALFSKSLSLKSKSFLAEFVLSSSQF